MDPVSLAASIAGLVSLAETVVSIGRKYYSGVRNAPREMSALIGETAALSEILLSLKEIAEQENGAIKSQESNKSLDSKTSALSQLTRSKLAGEGVIKNLSPVLFDSCLETLSKVQRIITKLECHSDETILNATRRLRWPSKQEEIQNLLARLERHKSSFQLAISADAAYVDFPLSKWPEGWD